MSLPSQIGRYEVLAPIATGGMAEILLGKLTGPSGFARPVVIKRILPHLAREESFRRMFFDEARVVSRIQHPNVVHMHELASEGDELFQVMEYLEGESVSSLLRRAAARGARIDPAIAAYIVAEACAGLHAAHELAGADGRPLGLVHRDVSPPNIVLTYDGKVKVVDFGIAKFAERTNETEVGLLKGKFPYMSPEQCRAEPLDRRSDVFSLGTILYELSTGRRLFLRLNSLLTMRAICDEPVPSPARLVPGYPAPLARICLRALDRDRNARYATAAEMRRDLHAAERKMGDGVPPDEALGSLLASLFEERIAEKRELLRRLGAGAEVESVPAGEVDIEVELPTVLERSSDRTSTTPFAVEGPARSRSLYRVFAGMAIGGLVVGIVAALFFGRNDATDGPGPAAAPAPAASTAPPLPVAPPAPPVPAPVPVPATSVPEPALAAPAIEPAVEPEPGPEHPLEPPPRDGPRRRPAAAELRSVARLERPAAPAMETPAMETPAMETPAMETPPRESPFRRFQ